MTKTNLNLNQIKRKSKFKTFSGIQTSCQDIHFLLHTWRRRVSFHLLGSTTHHNNQVEGGRRCLPPQFPNTTAVHLQLVCTPLQPKTLTLTFPATPHKMPSPPVVHRPHPLALSFLVIYSQCKAPTPRRTSFPLAAAVAAADAVLTKVCDVGAAGSGCQRSVSRGNRRGYGSGRSPPRKWPQLPMMWLP